MCQAKLIVHAVSYIIIRQITELSSSMPSLFYSISAILVRLHTISIHIIMERQLKDEMGNKSNEQKAREKFHVQLEKEIQESLAKR